MDPYVKSVLKALQVLDIFTFDDPFNYGFTLKQLSLRAGLAPNTLCKLMKTMVRGEYITQTEDHRYHRSYKMNQAFWNSCQQSNGSTVHAVGNHLLLLSNQLNSMACITTLSFGMRKSFLMAQDGQLSIPLENEYAPAPASEFIYTKATGRILVSFAEGAVFSDVLHRYGLPHELWDDIHTLSDFAERRKEIRDQGYCHVREPGNVETLAVPVSARRLRFEGALGVRSVLFGDATAWKNETLPQLQETAAKIARSLNDLAE